ncbi:MAG: alpha-1,2-fucosyltransferase [Corynebacteriales bacterium]|nr:alpha-1,2-fucosyltransferase [Mycobacteriales bacterium]
MNTAAGGDPVVVGPAPAAPHVSPHDIADGICVHQIGGGLGNQLFEYAAGFAQSRRLGCPLYIDVSAFCSYAQRSFEIDTLGLPGTLVNLDYPRQAADGSVGLRHRVAAAMPPLARLRISRSPVFRPASREVDPSIDAITPGTTLSGYFQSPRYFADHADELFGILEAAFARARRDGPALPSDFLAVHIRRGDYLQARNRGIHGLARPGYFRAALQRVAGLPSTQVLFTDSPELLAPDFNFLADAEIYDPELAMGPVTTLAAMAAGHGMVMSNSSFSWWAAWVMSRRDPSCPVVAPRPWHDAGHAATDLLLPQWLTLDKRL